MSSKAVNFLPPFMNFNNLTTWVDDHIKRRLHEVLWDIGSNALESVVQAKFQQNRHPNGITLDSVSNAYKDYFDRLLRGCIFHRLVTNLDGSATNYSKLIGDIVWFRVRDNSRQLTQHALRSLRVEMTDQAEKRYDKVINCWKSGQYSGYMSFKWANDRHPSHKKETCDAVIDDAINYISLVRKWPIFTRAIDALPISGNRWLFAPVD